MKNRAVVLVILVMLVLIVVAVRARGGGFLRSLAPMIHGTPAR